METSVKTTLTFSEEDVKKSILEAIKKMGFKPTSVIAINIGTRSTGFGMMERDEHYFQSITCEVEKDNGIIE